MKVLPAPTPISRFEDMSLAPELLPALEKMAISVPTEVQSAVIPTALQGGDVIAVAQTGSGKTLAYALSILTKLAAKPEARALVMAPSREMAQQIHKVFLDLCEGLPVSACLAIGGVTGSKQASQLKKNPRLIVATPGRMNDHLLSNKLLLQGVEIIVIDEADRMLDMGFAPQLKSIQKTLRGPQQTLMFSASFSQKIEAIAEVFMRHEVHMIRVGDAEAPVTELTQKVLYISREKKNDRLLDELNATMGGVIVFCGNQGRCEEVAEYLESYGFNSDLIHGDLTQGHRNRVIREFRAGEIRIVVATDLLARGLDVPHVEHVINFDLPYQSEDFLHRIGRTARAGRSGHAITFVTPQDARSFRKIKPYLEGAEEVKVDPQFRFIETRGPAAPAMSTPKQSTRPRPKSDNRRGPSGPGPKRRR
ncbi:MAG: DEAD/DEAH box helicase [Bdellovibrionales bacterium]|nr:DEAD/DEAH box helicase [Bdellovibrionales bacterium]